MASEYSLTLEESVDHETFVATLLEEIGGKVTRISTGQTKTPDFLVEFGDDHYVIELKEKLDDFAKEAQRIESLRQGKVVVFSDTTARKNVISGIIKDAADQLKAYDETPETFRIVWLWGWGCLGELYYKQFESALYGSTQIIDRESGPNLFSMPCYYFGLSEFYRHQEVLDAAIIWNNDEGQILLNDHSKRFSKLRDSLLVKIMSSGLINPLLNEQKGYAYYVDGDVDRRDERAVLKYIRNKYGRPHLENVEKVFCSAEVMNTSRYADNSRRQ